MNGEFKDLNTITVRMDCNTCRRQDVAIVDKPRYAQYMTTRSTVQEIFGDLTPEERDILMLHKKRDDPFLQRFQPEPGYVPYMCPHCYDRMAEELGEEYE